MSRHGCITTSLLIPITLGTGPQFTLRRDSREDSDPAFRTQAETLRFLFPSLSHVSALLSIL